MIALPLLALALVAAPATERAPDPASTAPAEKPRVSALWVRVQGLEYSGVADEVSLRLPDVALARYTEARPEAPEGALVVFVHVQPAPGGAFSLTLVASDGRAYDRRIQPDPGSRAEQTHELVARNVANLVFGIEAGTVAPDRADVPMPEHDDAPPECPACPEPEPLPPPVSPEAPPPPQRQPRLEIGPAFSLGILTGLGPPRSVDRFVAWGGGTDLGFRFRNGGAFVVGVRMAGRGHPRGARLLRVRVTAGGGYVWRPDGGHFELATYAGVSVEPWFVWRDGQRVSFGPPLPTIGGWARLAPGYLVRGRKVAARLGAFGELGVAYLPAADGLVLIADQHMGERFEMFRVGGPELTLGFQARLWFPVW